MNVSAIVGGTAITPDGPVRGDVLIAEDGTIAAVGEHRAGAGHSLDASGCWVLPGGVDPHCHLMAGIGQATSAAARGGTTTALSFTSPAPGESAVDSVQRSKSELSRGGAAIDVGLHAAIYDPDRVSHEDLAAARQAGAASIKIFLAYPELGIMCSIRRLFEIMSSARKLGLLVQVHCENGPLIEALEANAVGAEAARTVRAGPRIFADTRPPEVEEDAVASTLAAAALASAPCYLVHLSTAGALEQVRLARRRGQPAVFAETCLHHLLLDDSCYSGDEAARFLVCPPLRARHHVEALWEGLADGTIDAVGSDHCQAKTLTTGRLAAAGHSYTYGLAGIGPRLPLLLSAGMARDLPVGRIVRLAAENPARIFGHYPRKGALLAGSDADIVIFDPDGETVLPADGLGDGTADSVYAGQTASGRIRDVLLRGQLIVSGGEIVAAEPSGQFLAG
jgi:dihydropyrimidinase